MLLSNDSVQFPSYSFSCEFSLRYSFNSTQLFHCPRRKVHFYVVTLLCCWHFNFSYFRARIVNPDLVHILCYSVMKIWIIKPIESAKTDVFIITYMLKWASVLQTSEWCKSLPCSCHKLRNKFKCQNMVRGQKNTTKDALLKAFKLTVDVCASWSKHSCHKFCLCTDEPLITQKEH